jgi:type IV secretion system protein VirB6
MVATLMLTMLRTAALAAVGTEGAITIADAVRVCMAAGLTFLVMRQVMPMAAGLASGLALSTFGAMSAAAMWAFGGTTRNIGQFARGLGDRETSRFDSLSRKAGYYLGEGIAAGGRRVLRRPNQIRA